MAKANPNFKNVSERYFSLEAAKRAKPFIDANPGVEIIKLGVGDTSEAIVPSVIAGLRNGVDKLSKKETYTGYGAEADGANILTIFSDESVGAISDPVYPAYRDSAIIAGRKVVYMKCAEDDGFIPEVPREKVDVLILCSPNNPTGAVLAKEQLETFVAYAKEHKAIIIFDAAYSEYIRDESLPKSIYEIEGAKQCAIEIQSFSKSAGFTGIRLGWSIVPKKLVAEDSHEGVLSQYWARRQSTMFN